MMEPKWLDWAKLLQSIAQAGLTYSKDVYDLERFGLIRSISIKMLAEQTNMNETMIKDLFANETGYATPKVDIRAVFLYIFNNLSSKTFDLIDCREIRFMLTTNVYFYGRCILSLFSIIPKGY